MVDFFVQNTIFIKYNTNIMEYPILILGSIALLLQALGLGVFIIVKRIIISRRLIISGDAVTSSREQVLFYDIANVRRNKQFWNADLKKIKVYAMGLEITSVAFKTDDFADGIKLMFSGMMNSANEILHLIGSIKYDLWEISFDGGITRKRLHQIHSISDTRHAKHRAHENGWNSGDKQQREFLKEFIKSSKVAGDTNLHLNTGGGLLAHINETKTTSTTMRYQILIPSNIELSKLLTENPEIASFYYIYNGHSYKMDSKFIDKVGNLFEIDIINLKPGTIYTGFATSINGGKTLLPSSSLYGITKNEDGELPTIDEAILAKPKAEQQMFPMPHIDVVTQYLGEELKDKYYDVIVKKHYEDLHEDDYVSMNRVKEFYQDFDWLDGSEENKEVALNIVSQTKAKVGANKEATSDLSEI